MALKENIRVSIEGQLGYEDREAEIAIAKLQVICAEYGLDLTRHYE